jgi:hypothetical protein
VLQRRIGGRIYRFIKWSHMSTDLSGLLRYLELCFKVPIMKNMYCFINSTKRALVKHNFEKNGLITTLDCIQ